MKQPLSSRSMIQMKRAKVWLTSPHQVSMCWECVQNRWTLTARDKHLKESEGLGGIATHSKLTSLRPTSLIWKFWTSKTRVWVPTLAAIDSSIGACHQPWPMARQTHYSTTRRWISRCSWNTRDFWSPKSCVTYLKITSKFCKAQTIWPRERVRDARHQL